jgi:putative inorganic carbon (HCO3(-)) transporter
MSSQSMPVSDTTPGENEVSDGDQIAGDIPIEPPVDKGRHKRGISSFWYDRIIEISLVLSMAAYYVIGNENLGTGFLFKLNPLLSLPFLLVFAVICWYRLPFAIALFPLALPFYLYQKTVFSHFSFSLAEIALGIYILVALLQLVRLRSNWPYWLSWQELRGRLGPFSIPMLVFFLAATFSIIVAYDKVVALRYYREEIVDPLVYIVLALFCFRSRRDVIRLLFAMLSTGLLVAIIGMIQYFFFRNQLPLESDGIRRVHAIYGSANSIGLLFDYILPIGFALVVAKTPFMANTWAFWKSKSGAIAVCLPMIYVLYLTQSHGAWIAIAVAAIFIAAISIRNRKALLIAISIFLVLLGITFFLYHTRITDFIFGSHIDIHNVSTTTKRIYLWRSALNMILDSPWFGYGMNNWLCHYSNNTICYTPQLHHYWITLDPVTHVSTDLKFEPDLSHPHNVFLHIWVSIGIFGVLAFAALLLLFAWLFIRTLRNLRANETRENLPLQWMTIGVGAAMLAAMVQGLVDSAFLEQDLAFCFWIVIVAMLLLRFLSSTSWRGGIKGSASIQAANDASASV